MFTGYVLQDENKCLYKRLTNNLVKRLNEHKRGKTKTTSKMKNLKVVCTEKYNNFEDARKRELYLKSAAGRRFLKKVLGG